VWASIGGGRGRPRSATPAAASSSQLQVFRFAGIRSLARPARETSQQNKSTAAAV
jgi:hypothetical protein